MSQNKVKDVIPITVEFRYVHYHALQSRWHLQRRTWNAILKSAEAYPINPYQRWIRFSIKHCLSCQVSLWKRHAGQSERALRTRWHSVSFNSSLYYFNMLTLSRRPGILVLINDADWELEGEDQYKIQDSDNILFVSTLHGGWNLILLWLRACMMDLLHSGNAQS